MEYIELIKIVEAKRNFLKKKYNESIFFKRKYLIYINKYDALLYDLYSKLGNYLTINNK